MVSLQVQTSWLLLYETLKLRRQQKQTNTQMQEKQGFLQFGSHCNINPSLSPKSPRRRENEHGLWKLNYHALAIKHLISSAKTTFNLHCASKHYTSLDQTRPIRQLFPQHVFSVHAQTNSNWPYKGRWGMFAYTFHIKTNGKSNRTHWLEAQGKLYCCLITLNKHKIRLTFLGQINLLYV